MQLSLARLCGAVLIVAATCAPFNAQTAVDPNVGLRIEVPASPSIRIENQFGEITTEVWNEHYVSVSSEIEAGTSLRRSPVVIENRPKQLVISILRRATDHPLTINLLVKVPKNSRV